MRLAALTTTCLMALAPVVQAATFETTYTDTFVARQSLFGGQSSSAFDINTSIAGVINFSAEADSGTVDIESRVTKTVRFQDEVSLADSVAVQFQQEVGLLTSLFSTRFGASAEASVSLLGVGFGIIDEGATVTTRTNPSSGGVTSFGAAQTDTDRDQLAGAAIGLPVGISPVIAADVNLEQRSVNRVTGTTGVIQAINMDTGATVARSYLLDDFSTSSFTLDLSEAGTWQVFESVVGMSGTFDADFGVSATGTIGAYVGIQSQCGDLTTTSDNAFGCITDVGYDVTSPAAYLVNTSPFSVGYAPTTGLRALGSITVLADPVSPVPLPAGMVLMLSGLGMMGAVRARRSAGKAA